ncbi:RHS repeat-associated core domain-containing protein [Marinifilum sp. RC60d5]|uniref:RHS repeat-associated core domain-containing protein n=1 Tax=Marinifilum sp. RC60d5 TaxID=3458414 RepID=UPI0040357824
MFHRTRYYDPEIGRWFAIDPVLQSASPYMAMGNNPMIYIDSDGRTWKIFKKIGDAWNGFWDAANQFAQWATTVSQRSTIRSSCSKCN